MSSVLELDWNEFEYLFDEFDPYPPLQLDLSFHFLLDIALPHALHWNDLIFSSILLIPLSLFPQ